MNRFRKIIFWLHLISGITGGIVILVMCVTGALLAFEKNIVEFAERDMRVVSPSAEAVRLPMREMLAGLVEAKPNARPSSVAVQKDPNAAVTVALGRDGQLFVDPYTGAITGEGSQGVRGFFRAITDLHRYLAMSGDGRPVGKAITGACNLMFLFLAISGIYIWMPRKLNWRQIRPIMWFRRGLGGKARNFNWHNVIGFWCSLVLIVLTLSAVVISYQWAGNLLYTLTGNEMAQQPQNQNVQAEQPFVLAENLNALWARAESQSDGWKSISLRLPVAKDAVFTIDEGKSWNIFGRSVLILDAGNAQVAKWEPYAEQNSARQLRSWLRFMHTGESGGIFGQFIGFVASIGGSFLVYTGLALAFKRLAAWLRRRSREPVTAEAEA